MTNPKRPMTTILRTGIAVLTLALGLPLISTLPAAAVDLPVTAGAVDTMLNGNCSLVEAVQAANSGLAVDNCPALGDTIVLPAGSEFVLTAPADAIAGGTGLPAITASIVIEGNGATIRRDTTGPRFRLLWIASDIAVAIRNLTLQNGRTSDSAGINGAGGGIYNNGDLVLENVSLFANDAANPDQGDANPSTGGAITNVSTLQLIDCQVAFNGASDGSAIWSNNQVSLTDTWVFDNQGGYAILVTTDNGDLTVRGSTISRNADAGIQVTGGASAQLTNSTLSGNGPVEGTGTLLGGGIMVEATVGLEHVTITDNVGSGGGGIWASAFLGELTLVNTLIAGNVAANGNNDCQGPVVSQGGNLLLDGTGCTGISDGVNGDQVGLDPLLGPLADNGGPTRTHLPGAGSPALDTAAAADCLAADQRGIPRPQGPGCDIGAVEVEAAAPPVEPQDVPVLDGFGLLALAAGLGALALRALRAV